MTTLQKIRQAIYSHLQSKKKSKLSELMALTKEKRAKVRPAAVMLARKGLVKLEKIREPWPCKKNPERTIGSFELSFIEPWSQKIKPVEL